MEQNKLLTEFKITSKDDWVREAELALKGKPINSLISATPEGIIINPYYTLEESDISSCVNDEPGIPPYRRGIDKLMFNQNPWYICPEIKEFNPQMYNRLMIKELECGSSAIYLNVLNPDTITSKNVLGTYISDIESLSLALQNIDIEKYPFYFSMDSASMYAIDLLFEHIRNTNIDKEEIALHLCYDPFTELLKTGKLNINFDEIFTKCQKLLQETSLTLKSKLIGINTIDYRNLGANTVQEIAIGISSALEFINHLREKSIDTNHLLSNFHFNMAVSNDFFMEIAKFRATRVIWSKLAESLGGNAESQKLNIRAVSVNFNKSPLDKENNILRETTETLSAVIGGCQTITMHPFDVTGTIGNEFTNRVTRNTQLVIANECNMLETSDPAGGSWYIENLTYDIIEKSWELVKEIEESGGFLKALTNGKISKMIEESRANRISEIIYRREILIGVNRHPNQKDKLQNNESNGFIIAANNYRKKLKNQFSTENQNPKIEIVPVKDFDLSAPFIELRIKAENYKDKTGHYPKAFLAGFGTIKQYKPRMDFSREFLSVAGLESVIIKDFNSEDELINKFLESDCKIFVFCSSDENYPDIVPDVMKKIKMSKPDIYTVIAGFPTDKIESYKQEGINEFIHRSANIYQVSMNLFSAING